MFVGLGWDSCSLLSVSCLVDIGASGESADVAQQLLLFQGAEKMLLLLLALQLPLPPVLLVRQFKPAAHSIVTQVSNGLLSRFPAQITGIRGVHMESAAVAAAAA